MKITLCQVDGITKKRSYSSFFFQVLFFVCLFVFWFLGLHLWHMVVPRQGVESEL